MKSKNGISEFEPQFKVLQSVLLIYGERFQYDQCARYFYEHLNDPDSNMDEVRSDLYVAVVLALNCLIRDLRDMVLQKKYRHIRRQLEINIKEISKLL